MIDIEQIDFELDFKVLHRNGEHYICDSSVSELGELEGQSCWRLPQVHDAGIR